MTDVVISTRKLNACSDNDFYGDLRPILDDDLAAFVRDEDRHRSLTVVREIGERDVIAETRQWMDQLRVQVGDVDACTAMRRVVERWADGSRDGQLRGALAIVRLDERGHRGLAAAVDELWSVRAKDTRDFRRLVEFARSRVILNPSAPGDAGCRCDRADAVDPETAARTVRTQRTVESANPRRLAGIARTVWAAEPPDRPSLFQWAVGVLWRYVAAGHLTEESAARLAAGIAERAELDPAVAYSITNFSRRQAIHA